MIICFTGQCCVRSPSSPCSSAAPRGSCAGPPASRSIACPFVFLLWFFVCIFPSSGAVPLPDMVAEHRSYMASIGIFIGIAWGIELGS
jgi:hypothetical protein